MTFGTWLVIQAILVWAISGAAWFVGGPNAILVISPLLFAAFELTRTHIYREDTIQPLMPPSDDLRDTEKSRRATRLALSLSDRKTFVAAYTAALQATSLEERRKELWVLRVGAGIPAARWALLAAILIPMALTLVNGFRTPSLPFWSAISIALIIALVLLLSLKQCRSCASLLPKGLATPFWILIYYRPNE